MLDKKGYQSPSAVVIVAIIAVNVITMSLGALGAVPAYALNMTAPLLSFNKDLNRGIQKQQTTTTKNSVENLKAEPTITSVHQVWTSASSNSAQELSPELVGKLQKGLPFLAAYAMRPRLVGMSPLDRSGPLVSSPILGGSTVRFVDKTLIGPGSNIHQYDKQLAPSATIESPSHASSYSMSTSMSKTPLGSSSNDFDELKVETSSTSRSEHRHKQRTSLKKRKPNRRGKSIKVKRGKALKKNNKRIKLVQKVFKTKQHQQNPKLGFKRLKSGKLINKQQEIRSNKLLAASNKLWRNRIASHSAISSISHKRGSPSSAKAAAWLSPRIKQRRRLRKQQQKLSNRLLSAKRRGIMNKFGKQTLTSNDRDATKGGSSSDNSANKQDFDEEKTAVKMTPIANDANELDDSNDANDDDQANGTNELDSIDENDTVTVMPKFDGVDDNPSPEDDIDYKDTDGINVEQRNQTGIEQAGEVDNNEDEHRTIKKTLPETDNNDSNVAFDTQAGDDDTATKNTTTANHDDGDSESFVSGLGNDDDTSGGNVMANGNSYGHKSSSEAEDETENNNVNNANDNNNKSINPFQMVSPGVEFATRKEDNNDGGVAQGSPTESGDDEQQPGDIGSVSPATKNRNMNDTDFTSGSAINDYDDDVNKNLDHHTTATRIDKNDQNQVLSTPAHAAPHHTDDENGDNCNSYDHDHHHHHHNSIKWLQDAIPGEPKIDYPIISPNTALNLSGTFNCADQNYPGYYADVEARCQVFHVCQADGRQSSFVCPNGTIFSQLTTSCVWWDQFNCEDAPKYFKNNSKLYQNTRVSTNFFQDQTKTGGVKGDNVANTEFIQRKNSIDTNDYESEGTGETIDGDFKASENAQLRRHKFRRHR